MADQPRRHLERVARHELVAQRGFERLGLGRALLFAELRLDMRAQLLERLVAEILCQLIVERRKLPLLASPDLAGTSCAMDSCSLARERSISPALTSAGIFVSAMPL